MQNFTVVIIYGSYMFQLHISHHQAVYVRITKGCRIPADYIYRIYWRNLRTFFLVQPLKNRGA
jgi:hypothetical protein